MSGLLGAGANGTPQPDDADVITAGFDSNGRDVGGENAPPTASTPFEHVRSELHAEFSGRVSVDMVDRCFMDEVVKLEDARIAAFLPILIHRSARARLRDIEAMTTGERGQ